MGNDRRKHGRVTMKQPTQSAERSYGAPFDTSVTCSTSRLIAAQKPDRRAPGRDWYLPNREIAAVAIASVATRVHEVAIEDACVLQR